MKINIKKLILIFGIILAFVPPSYSQPPSKPPFSINQLKSLIADSKQLLISLIQASPDMVGEEDSNSKDVLKKLARYLIDSDYVRINLDSNFDTTVVAFRDWGEILLASEIRLRSPSTLLYNDQEFLNSIGHVSNTGRSVPIQRVEAQTLKIIEAMESSLHLTD